MLMLCPCALLMLLQWVVLFLSCGLAFGIAMPARCVYDAHLANYTLQQIPTQRVMLPQHLVYKNELNREYVITLARNDETPWWWSEKIETCRSGFNWFKWNLYRCICWLIVEVILRNARCNDEKWGLILSACFSFPLSVSFHQWSIVIFKLIV